MDVVKNNPQVLQKPEPGIFVGKVIDTAVSINVKPFCLPDDTAQLQSDLYNQIKVAFEKNKIKPPVPRRLVHSSTNSDF
jgi:small-conductance mechanosensitive channel